MFKKIRLAQSLCLAFSGGAVIWAPHVSAQTADAPPELQRVIVTGSNIRRVDSETPSPVQVITSEDLKRSGATSVQQVLQTLTSNGQGQLSQIARVRTTT